MRFDWKREWLPLAALAVVGAATLWLYPRLPDPMPIHWNAAGQPDDFGSRWVGALLLPAGTVFLYALLFVLPRIDPRRENIRKSEETYGYFRTGITLFLLYFQVVILYSVMRGGYQLSTPLFVGGVGVFLIFLGNVMPRLRSNWFVGIRTPWTLDNEQVWRETHLFAGRVAMASGALIILVAFLAPGLLLAAVVVVALGFGVGSIVYSYFAHRRITRQSRAEGGVA